MREGGLLLILGKFAWTETFIRFEFTFNQKMGVNVSYFIITAKARNILSPKLAQTLDETLKLIHWSWRTVLQSPPYCTPLHARMHIYHMQSRVFHTWAYKLTIWSAISVMSLSQSALCSKAIWRNSVCKSLCYAEENHAFKTIFIISFMNRWILLVTLFWTIQPHTWSKINRREERKSFPKTH